MAKKKTSKAERPNLTLLELKAIVIARSKSIIASQQNLQLSINKKLDIKEEKNPEHDAINDDFVDYISDLIARRLRRKQSSGALILSRDINQFIPVMIEKISEAKSIQPDAEEIRVVKRFIKTAFEKVVEVIHMVTRPGKSPHEEYWKWITVAVKLASERGIPVTELVTHQDANDEIKRQLFTRKQFLKVSKIAVGKHITVKMIRDEFIQPMIDIALDGIPKEERKEMEQKFDAELMPKFEDAISKTKIELDAWVEEEANRIYGTA